MIKQVDISAGPELEPVSLAATKAFLFIDGTAEDSLITALISAARQNVEQYIGQSILHQARTLTIMNAPSVAIFNLVGPLASVQSIQKIDDEEVTTTLDAATYAVVPSLNQVLLRSNAGLLSALGTERIIVNYTSGFGEIGADVPPPINQAILHTVAHGYEHRETDEPLPPVAKMLLQPFRKIPL